MTLPHFHRICARWRLAAWYRWLDRITEGQHSRLLWGNQRRGVASLRGLGLVYRRPWCLLRGILRILLFPLRLVAFIVLAIGVFACAAVGVA
jgi:hypothetical protein